MGKTFNQPQSWRAVATSVKAATSVVGKYRGLWAWPNYFATYLTCWQGELDRLVPMSQDVAVTLFEELAEKRLDFEAAFTGVKVEDA